MAIVKRLVKGSELTHLELDGNFDDLDNRTNVLEQANQSGSQVANSSIGILNDVDLTGVSADSIIKYDSTQNKFIVGSSDLVNDTTPQLGGDLDTNGNNIKVDGELVLATPGTAPTASGDPGDQGAIRYDDNFLYIKTASGWKKVALAAV